MKGVRCSWVDMLAIRRSLSNSQRGSQKAMEMLRCVDKTTVSTWRATCDVIQAVESKVEISQLSACQPSHALEISRFYRRKYGKQWTDEVKEEIIEWVNRCEEEQLTVQQLRQLLVDEDMKVSDGESYKPDDLNTLWKLQKRYGCIYADPPWAYDNQGTRAATSLHYGTMSVKEICQLPIGALALERSHLHLWTTNGFLFEAKEIMEAWGFTYKSVFVWCKPHYGIGNYWRVAHEFLLFGIRGECPFRDRSQRSWQEFPRGQHSAKPDAVRNLVEKVSPPDYLELFGRKQVAGWTVLGNEVG